MTDSPRFRNKPVGLIVLFRTILYIISLFLVAGKVFAVFIAFIFPQEMLVNIFDAMPLLPLALIQSTIRLALSNGSQRHDS